jgi:hypothetical protein
MLGRPRALENEPGPHSALTMRDLLSSFRCRRDLELGRHLAIARMTERRMRRLAVAILDTAHTVGEHGPGIA